MNAMNNNQAKDLVRRALLKAGLPLLTLTAKKVSMSDLARGSVTVITVNNWTPDPRYVAIKESLPKGCGYLVQFNEGRAT